MSPPEALHNSYHIAGKFGGGKFSESTLLGHLTKKFGELRDQPKDY